MKDREYGPIEIALLARLLARGQKPPSEADVLKNLRPFVRGAAPAKADEYLRKGLARLEVDGLREEGSMSLTRQGKKKAAEVLGLGRSAPPKQWRAMKGVLVELALGRRRRGIPLSAAAIRAAALAKKLEMSDAPSRPSEVLDAWAASELGMNGQRFTLANVRAYLLSRALGIEALRDPKRIGNVAIAAKLGVPRTDAATIQDSVLADWLTPPKAAPISRADEVSVVTSPEPINLRSFAEAVRSFALAATDGRFGRHKVFIGSIWQGMRDTRGFAGMQEYDFKEMLVEAHRAGVLRLSRADLTPAMSPDLVAASEVSYMNAVFHFVDLEGGLS